MNNNKPVVDETGEVTIKVNDNEVALLGYVNQWDNEVRAFPIYCDPFVAENMEVAIEKMAAAMGN